VAQNNFSIPTQINYYNITNKETGIIIQNQGYIMTTWWKKSSLLMSY